MLTPWALVFIVAYYLLAGLGVNLGYHRLLSHRSLKVPKWLEHKQVVRALRALGLAREMRLPSERELLES
jgi:fatty-acid desaturase